MAIKPVAIPVSAEEVKLIQRRQAALVMQMNKIDEAVRSGKFSKAEGENRKMFLKSEVDDLNHLKSQRRAPASTPFRPAPKPSPPRAPAKKYTSPTASRGSTTVSRGTSARTPTVSKVKTGTKKITIKDIPSYIGRSYGTYLSDTDKKSAGGYFYSYKVPYRGSYKMAYYGPVKSDMKTISKFRSWCKMHLGKEYTTYKPYKPPITSAKTAAAAAKSAAQSTVDKVTSWFKSDKDSSTKSSMSKSSTARSTVDKNPHGMSYGTNAGVANKIRYAGFVRTRSGGARPIKVRSYYYGPKSASLRKSWETWNNIHVYGKTSPTTSRSTTTRRKTVKDNPYTYKRTSTGYGTYVSVEEKRKMLYRDGFKPKASGTIKYGRYHYGPTDGKEKEWLAWNKRYGISGLGGRDAALIHREKQQHRRRANRRRRAEQVVDPSTRARAHNLRNKAMAKKRVGAQINTSKPVPGGYAHGKAMKQPRLQNTEIAGIAGGFSKTRNSMQRLLRR